jgi:hypothetical protein
MNLASKKFSSASPAVKLNDCAMLGDLPDYNLRIKKRLLLFAVLILAGFVFYFVQRQNRAHVRPSQELTTGLKVLVDPESVAKDL